MKNDNYKVYILVYMKTYDIYYVGYSKNYLRRFKEHTYDYDYKFTEIKNQGIILIPHVVEIVNTIELAREYEKRWIYHCIQTRQPIVNDEIEYEYFVKLIRKCNINFLDINDDTSVCDVIFSQFPKLALNRKLKVCYEVD